MSGIPCRTVTAGPAARKTEYERTGYRQGYPVLRLSKNHLLKSSTAGGFRSIRRKELKKQIKASLAQDQFASFFRFMAANLSFTQFVTRAKPR